MTRVTSDRAEQANEHVREVALLVGQGSNRRERLSRPVPLSLKARRTRRGRIPEHTHIARRLRLSKIRGSMDDPPSTKFWSPRWISAASQRVQSVLPFVESPASLRSASFASQTELRSASRGGTGMLVLTSLGRAGIVLAASRGSLCDLRTPLAAASIPCYCTVVEATAMPGAGSNRRSDVKGLLTVDD